MRAYEALADVVQLHKGLGQTLKDGIRRCANGATFTLLPTPLDVAAVDAMIDELMMKAFFAENGLEGLTKADEFAIHVLMQHAQAVGEL